MPLLRIEEAIEWLARVFRANREPYPVPRGYWDSISPTVDVFGTEKMGDFGTDPSLGYAEILGALGGVEVTHSAPLAVGRNAPRCRLYLAMEYWHDDVVAHDLRAGRVVPTGVGFPFVALANGVSVPGDQLGTGADHLAVRNFTVGPNMRAAVRADAMGAGARLTMRVMWVEFILGQYVRSIS